MLDLKRYAESGAFVAEGCGDMTIGYLEGFRPSIVRVTANGRHHFVVFLGREGDQTHIADPVIGNRYMSLKAFETMWDKVVLKITRLARNSGSAAAADSSVKKQSGSWNISTPAGD
jgi:predicted double-glycine peptidase